MKLSIIIVNYNVKFFLEQCLHSVYKAIHNINAEIFVVDNNSVDGSCNMINEKFPDLNFIENKENVGFSRANNQAIKKAKGEYVLLLNPDTVVEEDSFEKIIDFMDKTPDAGGLGVKMIDGKGNFLPESKRGLPTPMVAFYKIFGLARLFPKSKKFGKYHLSYLDKNKTHKVDVLAGAFMLIRKSVLDEIGLLDETFFMYGEDIDLSYRITLAGYDNYYFSDTTIIHYKGESTKKGSLNYVKVFYNAMIIFAQKHFGKKNAGLFSFFINMAIYFRALLAIIKRIVKTVFLPLFDAIIVFAGFIFIAPQWEIVKFKGEGTFPSEYFFIAVPIYIVLWLLSIWLTGGYDKYTKLFSISKGIIIGSGVILIIYALLPESLRFSRAMILIGTAWSLIMVNIFRIILHFSGLNSYKLHAGKKQRIALVALSEKENRITDILRQSVLKYEYIGLISPKKNTKGKYIGDISQIKEIISINKINEIIFCAESLSSQEIIKQMLNVEKKQNISYKIAPPESFSIIGSNSTDTAGDLYSIELNNITKPKNIRQKRLFDLLFSIITLIFVPILVFIVPNPFKFIKNIFSVLIGFKTWVGFYNTNNAKTNLPKIKTGIVSAVQANKSRHTNKEIVEKINLIYAKDFSIYKELLICIKAYNYLGS